MNGASALRLGGDSATLCCQQRELRRVADGFLLQEDQDPEARGLVVSGAAMWCWSWLLVRTGVCWEGGDYYRAVRRASRQVGIHGSFVFLKSCSRRGKRLGWDCFSRAEQVSAMWFCWFNHFEGKTYSERMTIIDYESTILNFRLVVFSDKFRHFRLGCDWGWFPL